MTPERFARVDALFNTALDLPAAERAGFLEKECEGDAALLAEVRAMVDADAEPGSTIDSAMVAGAEAWALATEEQAIGQRLGPYRITGFLGRGGMGAVYRAVRDDAAFEKEVAIKLLRGGMDSRSVLRRFEQERQILARLEHPHIARLLDGGTSGHGVPYLVMEFVEDGITVTGHCRDAALSLEKRLLLFLDVCSAVGYAHQNLIVHRDLKPGNILVDKSGSVKLLDFGIARVLSDTADQTVTVVGAQMLTPEYASPEQVRGEPVSTATDVYSLGIVLYELLTGRKAQTIDETSLAAIAHAVCETAPVRPSAAAPGDGPVRGRDLRGDLDNIILKALHKDREQRYSSVEQFAEDIRAFLQGLPVKARPDSFRYRAAKFLKRNRLPVALGTAAVLMLSASTFLLWRQVEATKRRFDQVRHLSNAFLFDFHDAVESLPGSTKARRLVVEKGLQYLEALAQDSGNDPQLAREVGLGYERLGDVQGDPLRSNIGDTKGAMESYRRSVQMLERAWKAEGQTPAGRRELQKALYKLGSLQRYASDTKGSLESFQRAILHGEEYLKAAPGDVDGMRQLARAHDQLGRMTAVIGVDEGLRSAQRAVQIREELNFMGVGDRDALGELASSYATLGAVLARMGKTNDALAAYQKSLGMQERIAAMKPDDVSAQRTVMIAMSHVGDTLGNSHMINLGRYPEAVGIYGKVVEKARWLVRVDPQDKKAQVDLAFGLLRYGNTLRAAGDFERSLRTMEESRRLLERLRTEDPDNARLPQNLGVLYFQFAELYAGKSMWTQAIAQNDASMAVLEKLLEADSRDAGSARMMLECEMLHPRLLAGAGRTAEAAKAAGRLEIFAQQSQFVKSKEPRVRALVARSLELVAQMIPSRGKELLNQAEGVWLGMEKEELLIPQLAAERDTFKKTRARHGFF
ncbi:MAG: serine/threonine protein kinase [Acidobacteria bacterium]|nr:serine/threonine protein kinase [Acidobacteriota bacterium]